MRVRFLTYRPRLVSVSFPQSRVALLAPVLAALASLAAMALLALTGYVTTAGYQVQSLERIRSGQVRHIQQLESEVAALASLTRAGEEAKARWNMAPPDKLLYIMVDVPAAASDGAATGSSRLGQ